MKRQRRVIGQTGSKVLSQDTGSEIAALQFKHERRRAVRYRYVKIRMGIRIEVIGPFHSVLYGVCAISVSTSAKDRGLKTRAKAALQRRLASEYGFFGSMLFSDVDEADIVGNVEKRLLAEAEISRPITHREAYGSAGK